MKNVISLFAFSLALTLVYADDATLSRPAETGQLRDPLAGWRAAVTSANTGKTPLRVVLLGDSNTEIFGYAGSFRLLLQSCYGSGGFGYYTLGKRMEEIPGAPKIERTGTWEFRDMALDPKEITPDKPWLAIDGLWTETSDPNAVITVKGAHPYTLYYKKGPGLGSFDIVVSRGKPITIASAAEKISIGREKISGGTFEIRNVKGHVALFGITTFNQDAAGGAVVHQIGNGWAMAHHYASLDQEAYDVFFGDVHPDLITILLGTNDMCNGWDAKKYMEQMKILLAKLRHAAPGASILVISSPSCCFDRKALSVEFDAAARGAASAEGCAFWSLHDLIGGNWQWWNQLEMMEYTLHYTPAGGMRVALELLRQLGIDPYAPAQQPAVQTPATLLKDGAKPIERGKVL